MVWTNIKYFVKEGVQGFFRNWTMSLASVVIVTACLMTFGVYLALSTNLDKALLTAQNEYEVGFFISLETTDQRVRDIGKQIEAVPGVKKATLVSKEEALEMVAEPFRVGIDSGDLPATYKVNFADLDKATGALDDIMKISEIYKSTMNKDTVHTVNVFSRNVHIFSIILLAIMISISMFIISNTIRITVFARKTDINIMMYVGATRWFVRWPFIIEGIVIGLVGAVISFGIMWWAYGAVMSSITAVLHNFNSLTAYVVPIDEFAAIMAGSFAVFGVLIGGLGSLISVRKHLHV